MTSSGFNSPSVHKDVKEKLIEIKGLPKSYETYRRVLHGKSLLDVDQANIVTQRDAVLRDAISMRPDSCGVEDIENVEGKIVSFRHDFLTIHIPALNPEQLHLGQHIRDLLIDLNKRKPRVLILQPAPEVVVSLASQQIYEQLLMANVKMLERKYGDPNFFFNYLDALVELL